MGESSDKYRELKKLLADMLDGGLDADGRRRIAEFIREDKRARAFYLDYCQMHSMLRWENGLFVDKSVPPVYKTRIETKKKILAYRISRLAYVAAAAVIVCVGLLSMMFLTDGNDVHVSEYNENHVADPPSRGEDVGRITKISGASFAWGGRDGSKFVEGDPIPSGQYRLTSGILEVMLDNGALIVIESPASFDLRSGSIIGFDSGRMVARIRDGVKGFTVETPHAYAEDLGTEFAIRVEEDRIDEFHVFDGEVIIRPKTGRRDRTLRLRQGYAVRIDHSTATPVGIDLAEDHFIRRLSGPENDTYGRLVMELRPVAYYNLEPSADGWTLLDKSPYGNDGRVSSKSRVPWASGRIGSALEFSGPSAEGCAVVPDYPKTSSNVLSGCAWVYARSRPRWATIAVNWGERPGQFHLGLFGTTGQLEVHINDAGDKRVVAKEFIPIPLNRWHHVAFVADGSVLRLYRNGHEVASTPYSRINGDEEIRSLGIGTRLDYRVDGRAGKSYAFWHGKLDEIAIFNHALTAADIERLYQAGGRYIED
jgi:hypothetical protein